MPGAQGLPHDIRGLLPYRATLLDYWPLAAAILIIASLATLGWYLWRRHKRRPKPVIPVDPWDALDARLAGLTPEEPFTGRAVETYFYELSLALREAVERRTSLRATDMTLRELQQPLRRQLPLPSAEVEAILQFLHRADLIKFAEAPATRDEATQALDAVRRWARTLRPREEITPVALPSEQVALRTGGGQREAH